MLRSPTRRISLLFFSFLVFAALSLAKIEQGAPVVETRSAAVSEIHTVDRVIDGDTFVLSSGEKVRLTGIDTPESRNNAKARKDSQKQNVDVENINKKGKEATKFVKQLVQGKKVRLEYDVQKRDRYGRLLVYAYDVETLKADPKTNVREGLVISDNQEIFLNGSIIRSGYASPLTIPPNVKHAGLFKEWYAEARLKKRGLWKE